MKITCQSCQSKYTVSDEKVQGKTVKIKCRKCGATILVNSGGVTTTGAAGAEAASASGVAPETSGATYLLNVADGDQRSMTVAEIVVAYQGGVVNADTYVWADGMADWSPLGQVEAIVSALNAPAEPAPSVPPPPAATPLPVEAAPAAAAPEAEHRAAARRDPGRRAQDLFSANRDEPAAAAAIPAPRVSAPSPAGMREENSMLFSLSALTAKVGAPGPSSAAGAAPRATTAQNREDSGIIDLKALAAAAASAPAQPAAPALMPEIGGLFPLGAPVASAPIAAPPVVSSASIAPQKSKTPIFIGVGAVVAVGAIVGAFVFMRGGPPPPPAAPATTATADPTPTTAAVTATATASATATPTDTAAASAAPSASASADAKSAKAVVRGGGGGKGGGAPPPSRGGGAAPAPAPAPAPAAPKKGGCGCAAGDLMCAMKCSAK